MEIELRGYQRNATDEIWESVQEGNATMLCLPTGSGKTEVMIEFVARYIKETGKADISIIVPSRHLVAQTGLRFIRSRQVPTVAMSWIFGSDCDVMGNKERGSWKNGERPSGVVVITGQSYIKREDTASLVITDEAHHFPNPYLAEVCDREESIGAEIVYDYTTESIQEIPFKDGTKTANSKWGTALAAQKARGAHILGVTATPYRLTLNEMFTPLWDKLIVGPDIPALIDEGFLCDYEFKDMQEICQDLAFDLLTSNRRKSETDDQAAARMWREADEETLKTLTERVPDIWRVSGQAGTPTVIFALNVKHALTVHNCFHQSGCTVGVVTGGEENYINGKKSARGRVIQAFERQEIDVLVNVGVLKEGFDCPDAETLIMLRPTSSRGLMLQMYGRVLRRKSNGKNATIIDVTDNGKRLGLPYAPMNWTLGPRLRNEEGEIPLKECPYCAKMNPVACRHCPECKVALGWHCSGQGGCGQWRSKDDWAGEFEANKRKFSCEECRVNSSEYCSLEELCDHCKEDMYRLEHGQHTARMQAERIDSQGHTPDFVRTTARELTAVSSRCFPWRESSTGNGKVTSLGEATVWIGYFKSGQLSASVLPRKTYKGPEELPKRLERTLQANLPELKTLAGDEQEPFMSDGLAAMYSLATTEERNAIWGYPCTSCGDSMIAARYTECWNCKN